MHYARCSVEVTGTWLWSARYPPGVAGRTHRFCEGCAKAIQAGAFLPVLESAASNGPVSILVPMRVATILPAAGAVPMAWAVRCDSLEKRKAESGSRPHLGRTKPIAAQPSRSARNDRMNVDPTFEQSNTCKPSSAPTSRNAATPRTELPLGSSRGENVPIPSWRLTTPTMPPPTPRVQMDAAAEHDLLRLVLG